MRFNPLAWFRREPPRIEGKASAVGGIISAWTVGQPVWTERDYEKLSRESYLINAIAHRCVKYIASQAAAAPWLLYQGKREQEEHPLLDLLATPSPLMGGASLFEAFYSYLLIAGNSYLEAVGPRRGAPQELWTLRPDRMKVIPGQKGVPAGYEYSANGQTYRWDADPINGRSPILHVKEFHPLNDWYGLGRVEPAAYGIDRHNAAAEHNKALLDNGARPSGALVFQPVSRGTGEPAQEAPAEVIKAAEDRMRQRHGGPHNAGRPLVLGGLVKWEEMGLSPKDMDFSLNKDDAARDICTSLGVPHMLIVPGESTYNNYREANFRLWESTILPIVDKAMDSLNAWLCPLFGENLRLTVDYDDIPALEPGRESKRETTIKLLEAGVIDANEAREALQYHRRADDAVGKVDATVLTALVGGIDQMGFEPLARYMRSVGLYDPSMTTEEIVAAATSHMAPDPAELDAAVTPTSSHETGLYDENGDPLSEAKCALLGIDTKKKPHHGSNGDGLDIPSSLRRTNSGGSGARFVESEHPRGPGGHFADKPGQGNDAPNRPHTGLDDADRAALFDYSATGYRQTNAQLRGIVPMTDEVRKKVAALDRALDGARLSEATTVYRGVGSLAVKKFQAMGLRKGSIITDDGFLSTSRNKMVAEMFSMSSAENILMEIKAKPGAKAMDLSKYSNMPAEQELLFHRSARMKVISYNRKKRHLVVEMQND